MAEIFHRWWQRFAATVDEAVADELLAQANRIAEDMRGKVHSRSGNLRASIRVEEGRDRRHRPIVRIKAGGRLTTRALSKGSGKTYDYALATELGTQKEAAEPFFYPTFRADKKSAAEAIKTRIREQLRANFLGL